jgi:hypothetical protein
MRWATYGRLIEQANEAELERLKALGYSTESKSPGQGLSPKWFQPLGNSIASNPCCGSRTRCFEIDRQSALSSETAWPSAIDQKSRLSLYWPVNTLAPVVCNDEIDCSTTEVAQTIE